MRTFFTLLVSLLPLSMFGAAVSYESLNTNDFNVISQTVRGDTRVRGAFKPPFYVGTEGTGLAALHFNDYQIGPGMYSIAAGDTWVLPVSTATDLLFGQPSVGYGLRVAPLRDVYVGRNLTVTDRVYGDGAALTIPLDGSFVGRRKTIGTTGTFAKPTIAYTPWWETFLTNNAAWCSNKINELNTNGFVTAVQAVGARPIWWWDDTLTQTNRIAGSLVIDSNLYPSGIQPVVAYARSKGFNIGMYTAFATNTCAGRAGTPRWAVQQDVNWFASISGMDALKVDNCGDAGFGSVATDAAYEIDLGVLFNNAIENLPFQSGFGGTNTRPVFLLASSVWATSGTPMIQTRVTSQINSWQDPIGSIVPPVEGTSNVVRFLARSTNMVNYTGEGHFTDLFGFDAPNMNSNTIVASMTACVMAPSPIIVGGITNANRQWFTNIEAYRIHQDDLVLPGFCFSNNVSGLNIWKRQLANGDFAVAVFNLGASNTFSVDLHGMGISNRVSVRDIWRQSDSGYAYQTLSVSAPSNSTALYRLTPLVTDLTAFPSADGVTVTIKRVDGSTMAALGTLPGFNNFGTLWLTPPSGSPSVNNYVANSSGASLTLNAPDAAGSVLFYGANSTLFGFISRNGLMLKSNPTTPPVPGVGEVYLWNSNNVLWGISSTKTNLISNLQ